VEARINRRIVQSELARRLDKPPSFVAKVELGERRLDVVEFVQYVQALGLSPTRMLKKLVDAMND
jgi:transcriptional regulator with XRE-family HTH domain